MSARFDLKMLMRIAKAKEVDIEVGDDPPVVIWVVLVGADVYVRSWRGPKGRWYRHLRRVKKGALRVGRTRIPVRATQKRDQRTVNAVSLALAQKYRTSASLASMVRPEVLPTTMRLDPL